MLQILKYYSKKDVQKEIVRASQNKEIGVQYGEKGFGKRPDIIQFEQDVFEFVKDGATSFHVSEEHWTNPLQLKTGCTKRELDELRLGWDCILDLDADNFENAKIAAELIVEALKFRNIKNISLKFSGNKGFHIGIPFGAFPRKVNNHETKDLFPDAIRVIAAYLKELIKVPFAEALQTDQPFKFVDIDSILISSRHLYRAPYSLNEKSGLVSLPIKIEDIQKFKKESAAPDRVSVNTKFLEKFEECEAKELITEAFDWESRNKIKNQLPGRELVVKGEYQNISAKIKSGFPPCINLGLCGLDDGKKRFLFILLNFLKSLNWEYEETERFINEWNQKNKQPLKEGYIKSQLSWHKKQKKMLPPNCNNENYYINIGICCPDNLCKLIKNPVNYAARKARKKV